jgi:hypothetical protein
MVSENGTPSFIPAVSIKVTVPPSGPTATEMLGSPLAHPTHCQPAPGCAQRQGLSFRLRSPQPRIGVPPELVDEPDDPAELADDPPVPT